MMFVLTKLLAMMPFGNFLRGPLGKTFMVIAVVVIAYGSFSIWLSARDSRIQEAALAAFNQSQIEQSLQDQAAYDQRLRETLAAQTDLLNGLSNDREELRTQSENILTVIQSGEFVGGEATEVLRETISALDERRILWEARK